MLSINHILLVIVFEKCLFKNFMILIYNEIFQFLSASY